MKNNLSQRDKQRDKKRSGYGSRSLPQHHREALNRRARRGLRARIRTGFGKGTVRVVRNRQPSQESSYFEHAESRFNQHYGLLLTLDLYRRMTRMVQGGEAQYREEGKGGTKIYRLSLSSQEIRCDGIYLVYDPKACFIVTFLPRDYLRY